MVVGTVVVGVLGIAALGAATDGDARRAPDTGPSASNHAAVTERPRGSAAPSATSVRPARPGTALALLGTLSVKGRAPKSGYDRARFGPAWADTDRNGCDTRNDVLARDLDPVAFRAGSRCVVVAGRLADPYTGRTVVFTKVAAQVVEIDHVVSLSNAWQTGALAWPESKRLAFANDRLNLLAVSRDANRQKSDGDAATWLPPNKGYRCAMVARQVAVKSKYGLWVTRPERDAISRVLGTCPALAPPTGGGSTSATSNSFVQQPVAPTPARTRTTTRAPATAPATAAPPAAQDYANYDAMHADYQGGVAKPGAVDRRRNGGSARYAPYVSQALYDANRESDADDDGVACEQ
jgi:hypothetical protein